MFKSRRCVNRRGSMILHALLKRGGVRSAECGVGNFDIDIMKHREILCDGVAILA